MKRRRLLISAYVFLISVVVVSIWAWRSAHVVVLTPADIRRQLEKTFPIDKNLLLATLRLSDPAVTLQDSGERIGLGLTVTVTPLGGKPVTGRAEAEGGIRYVEEGGAVYLDQPRVKQVAITGLPRDLQPAAETAAKAALQLFLQQQPIAHLRPNRTHVAVKSITIRHGNLVVELE